MRGNCLGPSGVRQIDSTLSLVVTQSDWIRNLGEASAKNILLVGIEIPATGGTEETDAAVKLVRHAYDFLLRGEYNAAIAECRRALESVWKLKGVKDAGRDARKALSASMDSRLAMGKRDRQLAVGEALINFAHTAHHVRGDGSSGDFSRVDASLAVASTAALISVLDSHRECSS
jgi:hypothetical protein